MTTKHSSTAEEDYLEVDDRIAGQNQSLYFIRITRRCIKTKGILSFS